MTQVSRVQAGHINTETTSDVGPYSADDWSDMFKNYFSMTPVSQGPLVLSRNEFEVTEAPANQLNVNTGTGVINGHYFRSNASMAFVPGAPAANPRIDVIVMCENNTAIQRTVGIATANNLIFPTDLTDYAASASIEPFTCRLVILPGNDGAAPVAPTLDVDGATLFMVPLAQYQIAVGGAVTAVTDRRERAIAPVSGRVLIEEISLAGGAAANMVFSNISPLFDDLELEIYALAVPTAFGPVWEVMMGLGGAGGAGVATGTDIHTANAVITAVVTAAAATPYRVGFCMDSAGTVFGPSVTNVRIFDYAQPRQANSIVNAHYQSGMTYDAVAANYRNLRGYSSWTMFAGDKVDTITLTLKDEGTANATDFGPPTNPDFMFTGARLYGLVG